MPRLTVLEKASGWSLSTGATAAPSRRALAADAREGRVNATGKPKNQGGGEGADAGRRLPGERVPPPPPAAGAARLARCGAGRSRSGRPPRGLPRPAGPDWIYSTVPKSLNDWRPWAGAAGNRMEAPLGRSSFLCHRRPREEAVAAGNRRRAPLRMKPASLQGSPALAGRCSRRSEGGRRGRPNGGRLQAEAPSSSCPARDGVQLVWHGAVGRVCKPAGRRSAGEAAARCRFGHRGFPDATYSTTTARSSRPKLPLQRLQRGF